MNQIAAGALRAAFSTFPSGVVALAALVNEEPEAMVASSFTVGVSLDPPLVSFAVQNSSTTWPRLARAEVLGVSVLGAEHGELCRRMAAKDRSVRFVGDPLRALASGALVVPGAPLRLECAVWAQVPAGDHHVVLLEVLDLVHEHDVEPLVFHGSTFRRLQGA